MYINHSTILGITLGMLFVFMAAFVLLSIYFPIAPNFFSPFLKSLSQDQPGVFSSHELARMREDLRQESIPIISASQTSTSEIVDMREELKVQDTQDPQPSMDELKKMRDELRSQQ